MISNLFKRIQSANLSEISAHVLAHIQLNGITHAGGPDILTFQ
jgi:hypothetical protein